MDALSIIQDFLAKNYGRDPATITPETPVRDAGIDSLVQLELIFEFEAKLGITVPTEDIPTPQVVGDLIRVAETLRAGSN